MVLIAALRSYGRRKYSFAHEAPFFTTPDGVQYFTEVRPAVAMLTMSIGQGALQPIRNATFRRGGILSSRI